MDTSPSLYTQLETLCLPLIESYQADLTTHDKAALADPRNVGLPFIHWTRKYGTHLSFLLPDDDRRFPACGLKVPYLFGEADRHHIVSDVVDVAKYWDSPQADGSVLRVTHYNGTELCECTARDAVRFCEMWRDLLFAEWNKPTRTPASPRGWAMVTA